MKHIPLTQGLFSIVDDEDYEAINAYKWYAYKSSENYYAGRNIRLENGKQRMISMHRTILKTPQGMLTDHRDGNGLNNCRSNIRICTHSQNQMNSKKPKGNCSSVYKGVHWRKSRNRWVAHVFINGKPHYAGIFREEQDAARAYDKKALEIFGKFARTNKQLLREKNSYVGNKLQNH